MIMGPGKETRMVYSSKEVQNNIFFNRLAKLLISVKRSQILMNHFMEILENNYFIFLTLLPHTVRVINFII